ncbi:MAG: antitoxin [Mycobacteriaceae bacterium]|nr:antitoxin [Mycobacteriaceae bacterium]
MSGSAVGVRSAYQIGTIDTESTQIAVRLPDEVISFIDDEVRSHHARSRAAVVLRALKRERRRLAESDAEILAASKSVPNDFDAMAGSAAGTVLDID